MGRFSSGSVQGVVVDAELSAPLPLAVTKRAHASVRGISGPNDHIDHERLFVLSILRIPSTTSQLYVKGSLSLHL